MPWEIVIPATGRKKAQQIVAEETQAGILNILKWKWPTQPCLASCVPIGVKFLSCAVYQSLLGNGWYVSRAAVPQEVEHMYFCQFDQAPDGWVNCLPIVQLSRPVQA